MSDKETMVRDEVHSKVMRAGRRTYFFDVRETRAGDYYLTITESKKFTNDDGTFYFKKHKIYLYKEDFAEFKELVDEMTDYIIAEKGEEVISDRHQSDYTPPNRDDDPGEKPEEKKSDDFTDVKFEDI